MGSAEKIEGIDPVVQFARQVRSAPEGFNVSQLDINACLAMLRNRGFVVNISPDQVADLIRRVAEMAKTLRELYAVVNINPSFVELSGTESCIADAQTRFDKRITDWFSRAYSFDDLRSTYQTVTQCFHVHSWTSQEAYDQAVRRLINEVDPGTCGFPTLVQALNFADTRDTIAGLLPENVWNSLPPTRKAAAVAAVGLLTGKPDSYPEWMRVETAG